MSAERIRTAEAARITGLDPRTLQEKAAAGLIPGARKVFGRWTYDQTSQSEPLRLVACTPGGRELETEYHRQFAAHRLHGEWFTPHADILAEIERLNSPSAHCPGFARGAA